jgi:hypothetical protein
MKKISAIVALTAVIGSGIAHAQQQQTGARPAASLAVPPDAPPPKNTPPGPYEVTVEANPGLPTHTIYRPTDLRAFTGKNALPIVSWGNGACANAGTLLDFFLSQFSSQV